MFPLHSANSVTKIKLKLKLLNFPLAGYCPNLPETPGVKIYYPAYRTKGKYVPGDKASFTCTNGRAVFYGTSSRDSASFCQVNGKWEPEVPPSCIPGNRIQQ